MVVVQCAEMLRSWRIGGATCQCKWPPLDGLCTTWDKQADDKHARAPEAHVLFAEIQAVLVIEVAQ
eukprot:1115413-Amphidinium_carterae.2